MLCSPIDLNQHQSDHWREWYSIQASARVRPTVKEKADDVRDYTTHFYDTRRQD